jgi:hypothetical protein
MRTTTRNIVRHTLVATAAAALTATLVAAPAQAEGVRLDDGADATPSLTDIRFVRARHSDDRVRVKVNFPDLRKQSSAGMSIFVDTDETANGPEYVLGTPLFSGSDYALWRMANWRLTGSEPVDCRYGMTFRWRRDFVVFSARRGCFQRPDVVRIGLRMRDDADGSHPVTDWLKGRRQFTRWLDAGASNA